MKRTLFAFISVFVMGHTTSSVMGDPGNGSIKIDFNSAKINNKAIPENWEYKGKPGTPDVKYSIVSLDSKKALKLESDKASGTILYDLSGKVDFDKYPIMRWKWRMEKMPEGADGRESGKDDQAIAIYIGAGRFSTTSYAYRWETETPKNIQGDASYAAGFVKVKWVSVRNKEDKLDTWYVEERNVGEDLKKLFNGKIPNKNIALSISANSQYTGTNSVAYLEYVEFCPAPSKTAPAIALVKTPETSNNKAD